MSTSILYVVNEAHYFLSHRLPVARAAALAGHVVHVAAPANQDGQRMIEAEGFSFWPIALTRRGLNPWKELQGLLDLYRFYERLQPNLIHHVTIKPVLYGGIAARMARVPAVVSAITGLGYIFIARDVKALLLRGVVRFLYRLALGHRNNWVIFQNPEDKELLLRMSVVDARRAVLIRGSGVDMREFVPLPEPTGIPVVVLAARMLWDKGVGEFVAAARCLQADGIVARFVLVGDTDEGNPAAISTERLLGWRSEGVVEWWGRRNDMLQIFAGSHIVCLPSYREGLPRVLIEAAACSRPIVTTDVPGCREIVCHEDNGLLVPVRNSMALAEALRRLIRDDKLRQRMGKRGRGIATSEFSEERVVAETMKVYHDALQVGQP